MSVTELKDDVAGKVGEKIGEKATQLVGNAAGAVVDPRKGAQKAKGLLKKKSVWIALVLMVAVLIAVLARGEDED
jgi:hypothetical protein